MKSILNPEFKWTHSADTDIRKTWARHGFGSKLSPDQAPKNEAPVTQLMPEKTIDCAVKLILKEFHELIGSVDKKKSEAKRPEFTQ